MVLKLANILVIECNWFLCVWGAAAGRIWLGPAAVAATVALHLALVPEPRRELVFLAGMVLYGFAFDSLLALAGVMAFAGSPGWPFSPLPMVALWASFGTAFPLSLHWLRGRYWTGALLGLVGGLLAYAGGVRLGAARLLRSPGPSLLLIGLLWAATVPLILFVRRRLFAQARGSCPAFPKGDPPMTTLFAYLTLAAIAWMGLLWICQVWRKDAGIVDAGWALGLFGTAILFGLAAPGWPFRRLLVAVLAGVWGLRLGLYLLIDRVLAGHEHEDGRYRRMRAAMGRYAHPGFLLFFQLQAGFILLFALPLYAAAANPTAHLRVLDILGVLVGFGSILGEVASDRQLRRFRRDPANRNRTCRAGLWRYSRHPNYFLRMPALGRLHLPGERIGRIPLRTPWALPHARVHPLRDRRAPHREAGAVPPARLRRVPANHQHDRALVPPEAAVGVPRPTPHRGGA